MTLAESGEKAGQPTLTPFQLVSGSASFSVQIPALDVALVKYALEVHA